MSSAVAATRTKPRLDEIDLAKGLGIFLVVFGHVIQNFSYAHHALLYNCIYGFHMPFFFFLSGITFSATLPFWQFALKKLHSLVLPAILFSAVLAVPSSIDYAQRGDNYLRMLYYSKLKDILLATSESPFSLLWFLYALFWLELDMWLLTHLLPERCVDVAGLVISFGFSLAAALLHRADRAPVPYALDAALLCAPFFFLGVLVRRHKLLEKQFFVRTPIYAAAAVSFLGLVVLAAIFTNVPHLYCGDPGNPVLFYLEALLGCFSAFVLCCAVKRNRYLSLCGRYSLYIYGLHSLLESPLYQLTNQLAPENLFLGDLFTLCIALLSVRVLLAFFLIVRRLRSLVV